MKTCTYVVMTILVTIPLVMTDTYFSVSDETENKLLALDQRMDELVYGVVHLKKKLQSIKEERLKKLKMVKWISNLIDNEDDDGRWKSDKKFKCGNSADYIYPFSVCDGVVDCVNGNDENNSTTCVSPIVEGSVWKGIPMYNKCNQDTCQHVEVTILKATRPHWFSAYVQIKARLDIFRKPDVDTTRIETSTIVGAYSFGTRSLFMHTWKTISNRIVLLAQFDGVHTNMCYGYQVHDTTMRTCAEYKFLRQS